MQTNHKGVDSFTADFDESNLDPDWYFVFGPDAEVPYASWHRDLIPIATQETAKLIEVTDIDEDGTPNEVILYDQDGKIRTFLARHHADTLAEIRRAQGVFEGLMDGSEMMPGDDMTGSSEDESREAARWM